MVKKMTKREMLENVVAGVVNEEVKESAKAQLLAMDKANENRKAKKTEVQKATDEVVFGFVTADFAKAKAIVDAINATLEKGAEKYSTSKVVASLKRLADEGKVKVSEVREKSRYVKSYALA